MDTDIEKLRITLIEDVSEDYYDGLYDMSVKLWEFYSNQFKGNSIKSIRFCHVKDGGRYGSWGQYITKSC